MGGCSSGRFATLRPKVPGVLGAAVRGLFIAAMAFEGLVACLFGQVGELVRNVAEERRAQKIVSGVPGEGPAECPGKATTKTREKTHERGLS
jgi:hypothetical protein